MTFAAHCGSLQKLIHGQGFDVIGISLDEDRNALTTFTRQMRMDWPQYSTAKAGTISSQQNTAWTASP